MRKPRLRMHTKRAEQSLLRTPDSVRRRVILLVYHEGANFQDRFLYMVDISRNTKLKSEEKSLRETPPCPDTGNSGPPLTAILLPRSSSNSTYGSSTQQRAAEIPWLPRS
jgi:hypothetical protein